MMTDEEIWDRVTKDAECALGEYPYPDIARSAIIGTLVMICALCVLALTSEDNSIVAGILIGGMVGAAHYAYWSFRRWGYRQRLRTDFWAARSDFQPPE